MRQHLAATVVLVSVVALTTACMGEGGTGPAGNRATGGGGFCESHYEDVVVADSRRALERDLVSDVPGGRLRIQGRGPAAGDRSISADIVDVLNKRGGRVMQVDVFRQPDGRWFAGQWSQCID